MYRLPCDGQMCERRERRDKCLGPWKRGVKTAALCRCLHRRRAYSTCHMYMYMYAGLCLDHQRAERDGPLRTGPMFCACVPCSMLDFAH